MKTKKFAAFVIANIIAMTTSMGTTVLAKETVEPELTNEQVNTHVIETVYGDVVVETFDENVEIMVTAIPESCENDSIGEISSRNLYQVDTYFDFNGTLVGQSRYYSGNHFSVDMTTSSTSSSNFKLYLRKTNLWNTTVANVQLPQNGAFHVEFLNVNCPGNFHFDFEQAVFGFGHQTGDMTIWNWD